MTEAEDEQWDIELSPKSNPFRLGIKDVWHYRDLLILLVRRDFVSFYKQTILGPLWFFIQPVITTITYTVIFANLAGIPTDGVPAPYFTWPALLSGITLPTA
ncbi:ABC transporter permease [Mucilaginibacter antarcticus]|uniref:ABC transporter permease n=1 Tax=Mucilaginibacter antarcticus TaxID=1855725 RepID=UPI00363F4C13